ncbi:hypothetical protein LJY18_01885 [Pseudomonas sp. MMS21-TM103]|uniref:hypothetical protein n=1 Tax=Pseudomonas sp. MMS21 TM103 TaxID=2886506 RepID=UPI001EDD67FC|nr:hypothetical protein [Pseudomonas sp. MMS21 TM103]MCG4452052.1 hypothetical protein [Pseudomonas sp. MMS21 TM103]
MAIAALNRILTSPQATNPQDGVERSDTHQSDPDVSAKSTPTRALHGLCGGLLEPSDWLMIRAATGGLEQIAARPTHLLLWYPRRAT